MYPNGCTHEVVDDDQQGVASIIQWLSYVPKTTDSPPAVRESADPVNRAVEWKPTPTPYDPRLMQSGTDDAPGFFDKGSYKEYLAGWGKSVVIGRGRLGGIPMGAISVETRLVEKIVPADPADPNSREAVLPQAGQVLFPDSSYKVAQAEGCLVEGILTVNKVVTSILTPRTNLYKVSLLVGCWKLSCCRGDH